MARTALDLIKLQNPVTAPNYLFTKIKDVITGEAKSKRPVYNYTGDDYPGQVARSHPEYLRKRKYNVVNTIEQQIRVLVANEAMGKKEYTSNFSDKGFINNSIYDIDKAHFSPYNIMGQATLGCYTVKYNYQGTVKTVTKNGLITGQAVVTVNNVVDDTWWLHAGKEIEPGVFQNVIKWSDEIIYDINESVNPPNNK